MSKHEGLVIRNKAIISEALRQLEKTQERVLICVDQDNRLKGVISDGDIRRALLKGAGLRDSIDRWMKKDPVFVSDQCQPEDSVRYVSDRIRVLPIVNHNHQVVDYHSFRRKQETTDGRFDSITVVGMGYVGLTLAVTLVDVGFKVVGFDLNKKLIKQLEHKKSHFYEKGLQKYLNFFAGKNLTFTSHLSNRTSDTYVVTVGTPIDKKTKKPILGHVLEAATTVGRLLKRGDLVVLRSTVPVGCTRDYVIPALEKASKLKAGDDFYVSFAPERTIEGQALKELRVNPQIIGSFDQRSTALTSRLFGAVTKSVIDVGTLEAAEISKLIDNSYRDHKFAFVNQLAMLCEKLNLDLSQLVDSLNHGYSRNFIPKPSPGVGGPCLSKDPYILMNVFEKHGIDPVVLKGARRVNESGPHHVLRTLERLLKKAGKNIEKAKILLIGFTFKGYPETSDTRDSTSLSFFHLLPNKKNVIGFDPILSTKELSRLGVKPVTNLKKGFAGADAVVILNNHPSYQDMNIFEWCATMKRPAVFIDTWHIFDPLDIKRIRGILYGGVGNV